MSNAYFKFRKFTIQQNLCAMKVGTDGVLLGAWASADSPRHILDVGTGTGLIALQLAQRYPQARVTAVEIDTAAAGQAAENFAASPWNERLSVECNDFRQYVPDTHFDLIVSNPPYFVDALKCPDRQRNQARHAGSLSYELLFGHSAQLLAPQGAVCIILPTDLERHAADVAWHYRLYPETRLRVFTKPGKPCRRTLLRFTAETARLHEQELCIMTASGEYSPEYIALTKDFYLFGKSL